MRKYLVLLAVCISAIVSNAQNVGIGISNPQNKLHVGGGFRLDTLTGVGGSGLVWHNPSGVVYGIKFSGNINDVLRGDGTFGNYNVNGSIGWLLNGNSGTNPATNFIGTIDDASLVFRIRNLKSGLIDSAFAITSFGYRSLSQNTLGTGNNAFGFKALLSNTEGARNTAVGNEALSKNTLGNDNTAVGYNALLQNIGAGNIVEPTPFRGVRNTAVGSNTLSANVVGTNNSAFGANAMRLSTSSQGSAFGAFALEKNGSFNASAFGYSSLQNNTTGNNNSAFGGFALNTNSIGSENTAIGFSSLYRNTGNYNSALGSLSLENNTGGYNNTALGYRAIENNSNGINNTAAGVRVLQGSNSNFNSAFGVDALGGLGAYDHNSAFGYFALKSNSGLGNTAVGSYALSNNATGTFNTAVGTLAGSGLPNNVRNVTCIGYETGWNTTLSNQVNIGDFSIGWIGGQTGWFHYSDKRIKNDIKEDVPGLAFITRLRPITYHVDIDKQEEIANTGKVSTNSELIKPIKKDWEGKYDVEKIKMTGFFAQDVEEAAKSINYSFNGVHNPKNGGLLSLDYSAFVVPLVKAVQEQQKIIEDQNKKIDKQQQQIDLLIKEMQSLKKDLITQKN